MKTRSVFTSLAFIFNISLRLCYLFLNTGEHPSIQLICNETKELYEYTHISFKTWLWQITTYNVHLFYVCYVNCLPILFIVVLQSLMKLVATNVRQHGTTETGDQMPVYRSNYCVCLINRYNTETGDQNMPEHRHHYCICLINNYPTIHV